MEEAKDMGSFKSVGDKEHVQIIALYVSGLGYNKLAEKLGRSTKTPHEHVKRHNNSVNRSGFCALCRRVGGEHVNDVVKRGMVLAKD